jgi:hypothetical protein
MYANVCWRFLAEDHRNEAFLVNEIINGVKREYDVVLLPSHDLRTALNSRCRVRATAEGLCLPYPCPYNGMRWSVTDNPDMVFDSRMHCYKVAAGWRNAEDMHSKFIRDHMQDMPRPERKLIKIVDEFRETQRQQDQKINEMVGVFMEMRRDSRRNGDGSEPGE